MTFHVPMCECGHLLGDHVSVRRPGQGPLHGRCFVCECPGFREVVPADSGREAA